MNEEIDDDGSHPTWGARFYNNANNGNGPRDGYLLIDDDEILLPHFISYEGVVSFALNGVTYNSTDIGVLEGEGSSSESLQLTGTGSSYPDFTWIGPVAHSRGIINSGQTITDFCTCAAGFTGVLCEQEVDDCESNPCQNGGTCTDGLLSYVCSCLLCYTGTHCEYTAPCDSSPCQNGGTCVGSAASYSCLCMSSYSGDACETAEEQSAWVERSVLS